MTVGPDGELLSVSVTQSRFTRGEVALLLASRRKDSEPRSSTGLLLSEATDPKNVGRFKVPEPITDLAAMAIHQAQEARRKKLGDAAGMEYLLWRVEKKPKPSRRSG